MVSRTRDTREAFLKSPAVRVCARTHAIQPLLWEREPTVLPAVPAGEPYGIAFWALIKDEFAKRLFSANHTTDKEVSPVVFDCVRVELVVFWVCWHSCPFLFVTRLVLVENKYSTSIAVCQVKKRLFFHTRDFLKIARRQNLTRRAREYALARAYATRARTRPHARQSYPQGCG